MERLEQFLFGLYNDGKLSTAQFQKAAALAQNVSASKVGDRLAAVASLGANGVWSGNAFRDFARRIGRSSNMPDLYEADVPCWDHEKDMQTLSKMYFLLPHELLNNLCGDDISEWTQLGERVLRGRLSSWCDRTGIPRTRDSQEDIAILGVWGDSAPYNTRDNLFLILFNVISGSNRTRFWVTAFPKKVVCRCGCHGRHTFEEVWKILAWSLLALAHGKYPNKRHDNKEFNTSSRVGDRKRGRLKNKKLKLRGACLQLRGDWSW